MTYFIEDYMHPGRKYTGVIEAKKPKEAVRRYLLVYRDDVHTIKHIFRSSAKDSTIKVLCTETGARSYFVH